MKMNKIKIIAILALQIFANVSYAVTVETTTNLNVFYPEYIKIDLVCGQMPKATQKDVEFCCECTAEPTLLCTWNCSSLILYILAWISAFRK